MRLCHEKKGKMDILKQKFLQHKGIILQVNYCYYGQWCAKGEKGHMVLVLLWLDQNIDNVRKENCVVRLSSPFLLRQISHHIEICYYYYMIEPRTKILPMNTLYTTTI